MISVGVRPIAVRSAPRFFRQKTQVGVRDEEPSAECERVKVLLSDDEAWARESTKRRMALDGPPRAPKDDLVVERAARLALEVKLAGLQSSAPKRRGCNSHFF